MFKTTKAKIIFVLIFCIICILITLGLILYKNIEDTFQGFFGSKVKLDAGKRRGKIIIEYTSNDDLERILGLIK